MPPTPDDVRVVCRIAYAMLVGTDTPAVRKMLQHCTEACHIAENHNASGSYTTRIAPVLVELLREMKEISGTI